MRKNNFQIIQPPGVFKEVLGQTIGQHGQGVFLPVYYKNFMHTVNINVL